MNPQLTLLHKSAHTPPLLTVYHTPFAFPHTTHPEPQLFTLQHCFLPHPPYSPPQSIIMENTRIHPSAMDEADPMAPK